MEEKITIGSRQVLSDKAYRLEEISFTKPGLEGGQHSQTNEIYFRPDAVAVLLVDQHREEFILAKQFRLPVFLNPNGGAEASLLEACAGLIEEGEMPEAAAIREVQEEMGYRAKIFNWSVCRLRRPGESYAKEKLMMQKPCCCSNIIFSG